MPDFSIPYIDCLIKSLQTDKRKKNVLTLARDPISKISAKPQCIENIEQYSNILENNNEPFWIDAGYLISMIVTSFKRKHLEIEGKSLSGTVGFWDVSATFAYHLHKFICLNLFYSSHL